MREIYKKILLAIDPSENAKRAAERVIKIQRKWNSEVIAFYSIKHRMIPQRLSVEPMEYEIPTPVYTDIQKTYERHGEHILAEIEDMFREENLSVETRLIKGKGAKEYAVKVVEEGNFDLVVLGDQGQHSKLERIFLGTVAEGIVNNAPCDVLVVR